MSPHRTRLALLFLFVLMPLVRADEPFRYPAAKHGKGEIKYVNHVPILIVQGTPQEMGEQAGVLALKPASALTKMMDNIARDWGWEKAMPLLLKAASFMGDQFPPDHLKEVEAAAKASGWSRDLLVFANSLSDLSRLTRCSVLMVEPARSDTGGMLMGRNLDWPPAGRIDEYPLIVVFKPAGKHAFASVTYPGMIGCFSAMNDAGLTLADLTVYSSKDGAPTLNPGGMPYTLALRRVLEECATVEQAEKLLRSFDRTVMQNVAICDTKRAAVFEITSKNLVVRPAAEGLCPCTNHFRTDLLCTTTKCRRFDELEKSRAHKTLSVKDITGRLDAAHQGTHTLQSMVFEPATLRIHLALGKGPATRLPYREINLIKALRAP